MFEVEGALGYLVQDCLSQIIGLSPRRDRTCQDQAGSMWQKETPHHVRSCVLKCLLPTLGSREAPTWGHPHFL